MSAERKSWDGTSHMIWALGRSGWRGTVGSCGCGIRTMAGRRGEMDPEEGWKARQSDGPGESGREIFSSKY